MATIVDANCSECFTPQSIEINPRHPDIECEYCGHAVPMFEKREIAAIRGALAMERRKMYIALALFAGAVFFFVLYVWANMGDPRIEFPSATGEPISGVLVSRDDTSITIKTPYGETPKYTFASIFKDEVEALRKEKPFLSKEQAAMQVGAERLEATMPETKAAFLFVLAVLASLAVVVFSFIASQDRVVAEF